jgi:hypothetical protein
MLLVRSLFRYTELACDLRPRPAELSSSVNLQRFELLNEATQRRYGS